MYNKRSEFNDPVPTAMGSETENGQQETSPPFTLPDPILPLGPVPFRRYAPSGSGTVLEPHTNNPVVYAGDVGLYYSPVAGPPSGGLMQNMGAHGKPVLLPRRGGKTIVRVATPKKGKRCSHNIH